MSTVCTRMPHVCNLYVTRMYAHVTCITRMCSYIIYVLICHLYITRMYLYAMVSHSYILVCHQYVTRIYPYVIRMSLVCTRMSSECHSDVLVCHPYVTCM